MFDVKKENTPFFTFERVHTNSRQKADLLYRRPANQNESHSSMTNKVHDASRVSGDLSLIIFCQMKELTPISKSLHFQCFKFILSGQVFHAILFNIQSN